MNEMILFGALASLITLCSILVVSLPNPVSAAIFLVIDLFLLAGVYAFQGADFAAAIQIIIYTGAILVLFLFVIMILNLDPKRIFLDQPWRIREQLILFAIVASFTFLALKLKNVGAAGKSTFQVADNTQDLALLLFKTYVWPFEIVSMLILLSIIGAISIARKHKDK